MAFWMHSNIHGSGAVEISLKVPRVNSLYGPAGVPVNHSSKCQPEMLIWVRDLIFMCKLNVPCEKGQHILSHNHQQAAVNNLYTESKLKSRERLKWCLKKPPKANNIFWLRIGSTEHALKKGNIISFKKNWNTSARFTRMGVRKKGNNNRKHARASNIVPDNQHSPNHVLRLHSRTHWSQREMVQYQCLAKWLWAINWVFICLTNRS